MDKIAITILLKNNIHKITYSQLSEKINELKESIIQTNNNKIILYTTNTYNFLTVFLSCFYCNKDIIILGKDSFSFNKYTSLCEKFKCCGISISSNSIEFNTEFDYYTPNFFPENTVSICTSGTTGKPKIIKFKKKDLIKEVKLNSQFSEKDNFVEMAIFPIYSITGLIICALPTLYKKGELIFNDETNNLLYLKNYLSTLEYQSIDFLGVTPTLLNIIEKTEWDLNKIKNIFVGGETINFSQIKNIQIQYPNLNIILGYGMTEALGIITSGEFNKIPYGSVGNCKTSKYYISIKSTNTNIGNIIIKNKENNYTFDTKDIGYIKDDFLFVIGRDNNKAIINGRNVYLSEIENILISHSSIKDVKLEIKNDDIQGEKIIAKIFSDLNEAEIFSYLKNELPLYKIPKEIYMEKDFFIKNSLKK